MAKRVGNVSTVEGLRSAHVSAAAIRHFVFSAHYRKELNLSDDALDGSTEAVRRIGDFAERLTQARAGTPALAAIARDAVQTFEAALFDDLNAPKAVAALFSFISASNAEFDRGGADQAALAEARAAFQLMDGVLDLVPERSVHDPQLAAWVESLLEARRAARARRDFAEADRIRGELTERGIAIEDTPQGTKWKVVG